MRRALVVPTVALVFALGACDAFPTVPEVADRAPVTARGIPSGAARMLAVAVWDSLLAAGDSVGLVIIDGVIVGREAFARIPRAELATVEIASGTCCFGPCTARAVAMFTLQRSHPKVAR